MNADALTAGRVSRQLAVGNRRIIIVDDLFAEADVASLFTFLKRLPYRLEDYDSEASSHVRHWLAQIPNAMAEGAPIFRQCIQLTRQLEGPADLTLVRAHANLVMYGDKMSAHQDSDDGVTTLYYANPNWTDEWEGETVFYENGEAVHTVAPRPGRLIVFDGAVVHRVGVPSRDCYVPRITVAFKFARP